MRRATGRDVEGHGRRPAQAVLRPRSAHSSKNVQNASTLVRLPNGYPIGLPLIEQEIPAATGDDTPMLEMMPCDAENDLMDGNAVPDHSKCVKRDL